MPDTFQLATTQWKTAQIGSVIGLKQGVTLQAWEVPIHVINEAKNSLRRVFYLVEAKYLDGFDLSTPRVTQNARAAIDQNDPRYVEAVNRAFLMILNQGPRQMDDQGSVHRPRSGMEERVSWAKRGR